MFLWSSSVFLELFLDPTVTNVLSLTSIFLFNGDLESPSLWGVDPILFLLLMIYKVLRGQGIFLIHFDL